MTLVDIDAPTEVRRDRWGRYLVTPPDGGKPVGYQRATTLAKMLEDTSNLTRWSARMTLLGAAQRPDIIASTLAADPSDRKTLDKLAEQAKEHGGANVRRDLVHGFARDDGLRRREILLGEEEMIRRRLSRNELIRRTLRSNVGQIPDARKFAR